VRVNNKKSRQGGRKMQSGEGRYVNNKNNEIGVLLKR
jgi:hypothetical protein